jgi:hypothetical protein
MGDFSSSHYRADLVDGVTVFRILDRIEASRTRQAGLVLPVGACKV